MREGGGGQDVDVYVSTTIAVSDVPLSRSCSEESDHGHEGETCGCAAAEDEHPFTINCTDAAAIRAAATTLGGCTASEAGCSGATPDGNGVLVCNQAFLILQAHHEFCPHDTLLTSEELQVHDFEDFCVSCVTTRGYNPSLPVCATYTEAECDAAGDSNSAAMAALATLDGACTANGNDCCANTAQQDAFRVVVAYHDRCGHDLPEVVEDGLHNYEHACEDYFCNTATGPFDANVCEDESVNTADSTSAPNSSTVAPTGGATATNTQTVAVTFPVDFNNLSEERKNEMKALAKTAFCTVLDRQGVTCDANTLGVVLSAGTSRRTRQTATTIATVTLPAGTNDAQAAAITADINANPITLTTAAGTQITSSSASTSSTAPDGSGGDSAASAGAQAFPVLVLALVAAGSAMLL